MSNALRRIFDLALPPTAVFDAAGSLIYANQPFTDIFAVRSDDFEADADYLAFQAHVKALSARLGDSGQTWSDRQSFRFPPKVYDAEYRLLIGRQGGEALVVAVLRDVTGHVASLTSQQLIQRKLADFVDCSSDWVWEADQDGVLTSLSVRLTGIVGVPAQLFVGHRFGDFGRLRTPAVADLSETEEWRSRLPFREIDVELDDRAGSPRLQRLAGVPVFDDKSGRFVGYRGTGTDLSQQLAARQALKVSEDQLDRTLRALRQKNEELVAAFHAAEAANRSKSQFLANVSHELRTPLNAILGFSEILKMEFFGALGSEQYKSYARDIHTSAAHLLDLITDILDLSTIEAGRRELFFIEVEVGEEIQYAQRLIAEQARQKEIALEVRTAEGLPRVQADRRSVRQMLTNLLTNAVKFTPAGGRVSVDARREEGGAGAERVPERVVVTVRDNGIGIPPEDIQRILQPFERGGQDYSRQQDGTGLGLALTKSLADLHGGSLAIESQVGEGTAVTLALPVIQPPGSEEARAAMAGVAE
jgi:signal transduction histidine kinase